MDWLLALKVLYYTIAVLVSIKVILDTRSPSKATAYLLLIALLPIAGIIVYIFFGRDFRKRKLYSQKRTKDQFDLDELGAAASEANKLFENDFLEELAVFQPVAEMLNHDTNGHIQPNNEVNILINGEQKFDALFKAISQAKEHIHIEYYIYADDDIGNKLADALIEKAKEGVAVRLIYDDFGSSGIGKLMKRLQAVEVEAHPFYKVIFTALADRLNYRNHRKIVVIDGHTGFVGGINVADEYLNTCKNEQYWRDTHMCIIGKSVWSLQRIFLNDWNFCAEEDLPIDGRWFNTELPFTRKDRHWLQIVHSGPDSPSPSIKFAFLQAIHCAQESIYICTPYFIPGESLLQAMHMALLRGVEIILLVPKESDSRITNAASRSYYQTLLDVGAKIYLYEKGFIHAKVMICDETFASIGTSNFDNRSFELNFEVNALIYDVSLSRELAEVFKKDLEEASKVDVEVWRERSRWQIFTEKLVRLVDPLL